MLFFISSIFIFVLFGLTKTSRIFRSTKMFVQQEFKCLAECYAIARIDSTSRRFCDFRLPDKTLCACNKSVSRKRAQPAVSGRRSSLNSRDTHLRSTSCVVHTYIVGECALRYTFWPLVSPSGLLLLYCHWSRSFFGNRFKRFKKIVKLSIINFVFYLYRIFHLYYTNGILIFIIYYHIYYIISILYKNHMFIYCIFMYI